MAQLIYFADDEKNIRELIYAFLTQAGYEVRTFANGEELLNACNETTPDLVVVVNVNTKMYKKWKILMYNSQCQASAS